MNPSFFTNPLFLILGLVVLLGVFIWTSYNSIITLNERVSEAFSDITIQLKYRADLIPNLVETVKGYAKHEREVFENITQARSSAMKVNDVKSAAEAEKLAAAALTQLYAVAENYPDLKANTNFLQLQSQLQEVEDKIQAARRFYNSGAQSLNTKLKLFPTNLLNSLLFHFAIREYFEVSESEKARIDNAPEIKF